MRNFEDRGPPIDRRDVSTTNRTDTTSRSPKETNSGTTTTGDSTTPNGSNSDTNSSNSDTNSSTKPPDVSDVCPESLIVVSNRQPYRHEYDESEEGSITVDEPTGGLTAGLDPVLCRSNGTWIAWGDGDADEQVTDQNDCVRVPPDEESYTLRRLWLSDEAVNSYYYGWSNRVLWPLCHGFSHLIDDRPGDLEWYRTINHRFASAVSEHVSENTVVWLQDYHLGFAPKLIRERVSDSVTIAHFWHIPWPSPETFVNCPEGKELLEGLLGNDLLGFHVDRYADLFLECVDRFVENATVHRSTRTVSYDGNTTRVVATPMGIDASSYAEESEATDESHWKSICSRYDIPRTNTIGLGVDRLDYTKGIPQRLTAIETFFDRNPEWRGQFTFVQKATPSRTDIPAYEQLGEAVRQQVDRINARFGAADWRPIVYTEDILPQDELCALYRRADVMVVSPVNDGMNLVAQEYLASSIEEEGALLLSNRAGAHETLGSHTYTIAPDQPNHFANTIERALTTAPGEKQRRMSVLRDRVFEGNLESWMRDQFVEIQRIHSSTDSMDERPNEQQSPVS
ncbi:trehalose-6-phosphate synthase [Halostagnicola sp. A-GB9-2]|uniref:alpha,alpha-trehalose-phosphate synthase (UDP-forming) n=1 Tax=Halostagnicola sp. A-GB9-2 TaxID=3048066 RepID=UPI0024BF3A3E|nr:trehalose-6-phosphate synthase [Halostagnicola sp. A-GB9-2]MDJ1434097.1 trehalose-6-phosphate synthase [Halostagnicola sp. A-GB9-2]